MTSRDTYDIDEAEKMDKEEQQDKKASMNLQIPMIMHMIRESEPDLFGLGTAKLWPSNPHKLNEIHQELYDKMLLAANMSTDGI